MTWTTSRALDGASKDRSFRRNVIIYTMASAMGGLVHLAHLLWTHLLDQADYGRFAILEGVVFGLAASTVTLAPQQYILVYVHKKAQSELARALAMRPGLLLLDEAMSGLNPSEMERAMGLIRRIRDELGMTVIWVEHIMKAIMGVADRVLVLNFGELIALGTPAEVARDEGVIDAYLGSAE